jgi:glycosyltransferase involved in cell wall biosynthesis
MTSITGGKELSGARLGVIPTLSRQSGGLYQYAQIVLEALRRDWWSPPERSVTVLGDPIEIRDAASSFPSSWQTIALSPKWDPRRLRHMLRKLRVAEPVGWAVRHLTRGRVLWGAGLSRNGNGWDERHALDLTLWTTARREVPRFNRPMAVAFHDIQHRMHTRFPEFSAGARDAALEHQQQLAAARATIAIAESETGMQYLLDAYGDTLSPDRIRVLHYPPPPHITADGAERRVFAVRRTYRLPDRYLFYPAQFWEHKNHALIVRALALLRSRRREVPALVLSGSREGQLRNRTFREVRALAARLGVDERLVVLDYVPDEDMSGLYLGAAALVMPTFCGPSNIPVLEAWVTGCPVVTSDIRGVREQAGNAALLIDPTSPEDLAAAIQTLWTDSASAERLAQAGRERLREFTMEAFARGLRAALQDTLALGARTNASR